MKFARSSLFDKAASERHGVHPPAQHHPSATQCPSQSNTLLFVRHHRWGWRPISAAILLDMTQPLDALTHCLSPIEKGPLSTRPLHLHPHKFHRNIIMAFSIEDFTVPEDQVKAAKEVFKRFDKRGQEKISTNDLGPAFRALNLTVKPDQLKEWADEVDEDATGFIDSHGFLVVYAKKLQEDQDEKDLREAFRVLDKNKRGEIDVEDLRWILKGLGDDLTEEEIDDMIRDTDTDGSGFVDFDEFYKLMTSE